MHQIHWGKIKDQPVSMQKNMGQVLNGAMGFQWGAQLTWNPAVRSVALISWSRGLPFWEGLGLCEADMAERGERSYEWDQPCPVVIGTSTNTFQNYLYFSRYACQRCWIWNAVNLGLWVHTYGCSQNICTLMSHSAWSYMSKIESVLVS